MFLLRFWLVAALLLLTILEFGSVQAAEVRCASGISGHYSLPQKEEWFARRWPSGVRPNGRTCAAGVILGPIENGDYEKVLALYRLNHPFLWGFELDSPGGNVAEAIKIGRFFRKYLISASAPIRIRFPEGGETFITLGDEKECDGLNDCICASACALIWFGAVERNGTVGLHRPRTTDPYFRALDPSDGATTYRKVLDSIQAYLDEMEVPKPMIELTVATGSANIRWVTDNDDLNRPPSLAEWEDATCGSFSTNDKKLLDALNAKKSGLTRQEQSRRDQLRKKQDERSLCQIELLSSHRDKLPLP
jgi:hypothetical protein